MKANPGIEAPGARLIARVAKSNQDTEARMARLEAVAAAVERWLADPRYVTEQLMIKALRELRELDRRS